MNDSLNSIEISGVIAQEPEYDHTVFGEAFYRMLVSVKRLSGNEDILPVTVSERLLGSPEENAAGEGSAVSVKGQIRSYNRTTDTGSHLIITVFAREIDFSGGSAERDANKAELIGHVCKPVIYRTTPFSREIADVLVAVNRRYGKSDYLPCIAWGRNARFAGSLVPGDAVLIRGRMQSREYQKALPEREPEQRIAYEISCSSLERISL
jgi:single-stranded DNA-binding protein